MKATGRFVRICHLFMVGTFGLATCCFLGSIAIAGGWENRLLSLLAFLVLGAPLLLLVSRILRDEPFYPPDFLQTRPGLAVLFAALNLVATAMLLIAIGEAGSGAADLSIGQGMPGMVTYGAMVAWLTLLAQELLFRAMHTGGRHRTPVSR